ncbi:MAG: AgmX/PglI C-terminal domain-containing protein [Polyangiaceae bacterium]
MPQPVAGPTEVALGWGGGVVSMGSFVVVVAAEEPARRAWAAGAGLSGALSPMRHVALAAAAHALLMGLSAQSAHASGRIEEEASHDGLRQYLAAAEERSRALESPMTSAGAANMGVDVNERDGNGKDGGGTRAKGAEGAMGASLSRAQRGGRFGVSGGGDKAYSVARSREEAIAEARSFGIAGVLGNEPISGPVSGFADAVNQGPDPFDARGAMWSGAVGETFGAGGLGLTGTGDGGGGRGEGIGLGTIGTIGHTDGRAGTGTGGGGGPLMGFGGGGWGGPWGSIGIGIGTIGRIGRVKHGEPVAWDLNPRDRPRKAEEDGENRLPPDAIRRVVQQNHGRFRACYERGLAANPSLSGGVTTKFLIGAGGLVKSAANLGADLADKDVVSCVTRTFAGLAFPEPPDGRPVTVTYPLTFSPTK